LGNGNGGLSSNNFANPIPIPVPVGGPPIFSGDFTQTAKLDLAMNGLIALGNGDEPFKYLPLVLAGCSLLWVISRGMAGLIW
jgi:hypothetical protein